MHPESKSDFETAQIEGRLYIVATPIGNLSDMTTRAIQTLENCDVIAVEDSRHSRHLLNHLGIHKRLISYHDHNERQRADQLLKYCLEGKKVALISDAGTPLISDPGYQLVKKAHQKRVTVIPVPGPCAAIAALSVAGIPSDQFCFEGFLPAKKSAREARLTKLSRLTRTMIFYESTHRIVDFLKSMEEIFSGQRWMTLVKEISKTHETVIAASVTEVIHWLQQDVSRQKGEFVVVVSGYEGESHNTSFPEDMELMTRLLSDLTIKKASQLASDLTGKGKNHFYQIGLLLKHSEAD